MPCVALPVRYDLGRHGLARNDGAGMADHDAGETMAGARGLDRVGAGQPRGDIGRGKTVTGRGGVDDGLRRPARRLTCVQGALRRAAMLTGSASFSTTSGARDACQQTASCFRRDRAAADPRSRPARYRRSRRPRGRPRARRRDRASRGRGNWCRRRCACRAGALARSAANSRPRPLSRIDRERDRGEIDEIVGRRAIAADLRVSGRSSRLRAAALSRQWKNRRSPFASVWIMIEAGQLARQPRHLRRADALRSQPAIISSLSGSSPSAVI